MTNDFRPMTNELYTQYPDKSIHNKQGIVAFPFETNVVAIRACLLSGIFTLRLYEPKSLLTDNINRVF